MYFKPKNNLLRVVEELKSRNNDFSENQPKFKERKTVTRFHPRKTWISLQNFVAEPQQHDNEPDESVSEEIVPKQILAGLHNKTYFKGVTSLLLNPDTHAKNGEGFDRYAEQILETCNVKPSSISMYLKAGEGKLVSNPEEQIKDTYLKLRQSMNGI